MHPEEDSREIDQATSKETGRVAGPVVDLL